MFTCLIGLLGVLYQHDCVFLFPQLSMEKVQAMAEQVEIKAKVVQTEVKALVLRHKKALEERECELLWKVSSAVQSGAMKAAERLFLRTLGADSFVIFTLKESKEPLQRPPWFTVSQRTSEGKNPAPLIPPPPPPQRPLTYSKMCFPNPYLIKKETAPDA